MFQEESGRSQERGHLWGSDAPPPEPAEAEPAPREPEGWRGRDVVLGLGLFFLGFVVLLISFTVAAAVTGLEGVTNGFTITAALILLVFEAWLALLVVGMARYRRIGARGLGFVWPRRWSALPVSVFASYLALGFYLLSIQAIERVTEADLGWLAEGNPIPVAEHYTLGLWIVLGLGVVVAAPLAEELFFRAFLFRAMDAMWPTALAMTISGFAFALVHLNISVVIPFTVIGIIFAWAYKSSGSLWIPIGAHVIVNGVSFTLTVMGVQAA